MDKQKFDEIYDGWNNLAIKHPNIEKIAAERATECSSCEEAVSGFITRLIPETKSFEKIQGQKCLLCGCPLSAKIRSVDSECPRNLWTKYMRSSTLKREAEFVKTEVCRALKETTLILISKNRQPAADHVNAIVNNAISKIIDYEEYVYETIGAKIKLQRPEEGKSLYEGPVSMLSTISAQHQKLQGTITSAINFFEKVMTIKKLVTDSNDFIEISNKKAEDVIKSLVGINNLIIETIDGHHKTDDTPRKTEEIES